MTDKSKNIVVLSSPHLVGWGLDPDKISAALAGRFNVAEVKVVSRFSVQDIGPLDDNARLFLVGTGEMIPDVDDCHRQYPLKFDAALNWSAGSREVNLGNLIHSVLETADLESDPATTSWKPLSRVMVYGRTTAAAQAVSALHQAGIEVVWAAVSGDVPMPDGYEEHVDVIVCRRMKRVDGFAGRFSIVLDTENGDRLEPAAAIWLCGPELRETVWKSSSDQSASLPEFEKAIISGELPDWAGQEGFKLVFLAGVNSATSTACMGRLLAWARRAAQATKATVYFLTPHVKVASFGLERLYGEARDAGVVFIRTPMDGPGIETKEGRRATFVVWDPVAGATLRLTPDLVVTEQSVKPAHRFVEWSENTGLFLGPDGFLSPDNVLYLPSLTNRRGIFALGAVRGTDNAETLAAEIAGALAETSALLSTAYLEAAPVTVDETRCAHCLSCVRICPADAIRFTERPWPDPASCVACGLCVSRCPAEALSLYGFTREVNRVRLQYLLGDLAQPASDCFVPRLVAFGCRRSAEPAMSAAAPPKSPVDLSFMALPCGGHLDEQLVLKAFLKGADGVIVMACHEDNCRTQEGSPEAKRRSQKLKRLLADLGVDQGRLAFTTLAPNQGMRFGRMVAEFAESVKSLGPARLRGLI